MDSMLIVDAALWGKCATTALLVGTYQIPCVGRSNDLLYPDPAMGFRGGAVMPRPYVPETREGIRTFVDCDGRYPDEEGYNPENCRETFLTCKCEDAVKLGLCPRGFAV